MPRRIGVRWYDGTMGDRPCWVAIRSSDPAQDAENRERASKLNKQGVKPAATKRAR